MCRRLQALKAFRATIKTGGIGKRKGDPLCKWIARCQNEGVAITLVFSAIPKFSLERIYENSGAVAALFRTAPDACDGKDRGLLGPRQKEVIQNVSIFNPELLITM